MIELSPAQAAAVAMLAQREGGLVLHQIGHARDANPDDVYATPVGAANGFRISRDGSVAEIGETLPAPG